MSLPFYFPNDKGKFIILLRWLSLLVLLVTYQTIITQTDIYLTQAWNMQKFH